MKLILHLSILIFLLSCESVSRGGGKDNLSSDIRSYNYLINAEDTLARLNDTISIASKYIGGDLLYRGYYINGALNGPIDIYRNGNKFAYGLMENNKPTGLFRFMEESFERISLRNERYITNKLGTYHQLEFDAFLRGEKYYYMSSVFLLKNSFIIVLAMAEAKSETDYYLYSALFKEIVFRLRHQEQIANSRFVLKLETISPTACTSATLQLNRNT